MLINILGVILAGVAGYLLGSVNTSLVVGKIYGIDVRQHGSRNAGLTNVLRTLGKKAAVFVLIGDVLKGVLSCVSGMLLAGDAGAMAGGAAAVAGHNWPVFFGFKGGKGALTSIAVVFVLDWRIGLLLLAVFGAAVAATRYVSLGSMLGAASFPVLSILFNKNTEFIIFALFIGLLAIARHRSNIERIFAGTEAKLEDKKKNT